MTLPMYSDKVRRLVAELPGSGSLSRPTHEAERYNPICGDHLRFQIAIDQNGVNDLRYQVSGCPGAIASAAAVALLCRKQSVAYCRRLEASDILEYLEGLPRHKLHGVELALQTLLAALGEAD